MTGRVGLMYIADKYRIFIRKYRIFRFLSSFKNIFIVTHCDYALIFSLCVSGNFRSFNLHGKGKMQKNKTNTEPNPTTNPKPKPIIVKAA